MAWHIPFLNFAPQHNLIRETVQEAFARVYDRNWFVLGTELEGFEKEFAAYTGAPYCLGVGNGMDALTMALQSCRLTAKDEVIVPAHTYLATWNAVSKCGAKIVPLDADPATFNIDTSRLEEVITHHTKVILPVHMYGQPCNMTAIDQLARHHSITVVEDNAQAHGAMWLEKRTGSFGAVNATSFYPTKNLGALGDGGAVTTFDAAKAEFIRRQRSYGLESRNVASEIGSNSRLDEIQAAFLRVKLQYLDAWNSERREIAEQYLQQLQGVGDLILPLCDKEATHVYHLFVIRTNYRDQLREHLAAHGIDTLIHYPIPPHLQESYRHLGFKKGSFPIAERIADTCLSLPLWPGMNGEQVEYVCDKVAAFTF